jgi:hypothetical protein
MLQQHAGMEKYGLNSNTVGFRLGMQICALLPSRSSAI